jgi:hypothetical protein
MPEISRFLGIVIYMYCRDHALLHFHAEYGDYEITVEIESDVITGKFPRCALSAVIEWYIEHKGELLENWQRAEKRQPLQKIGPLE